MFAGTPEGVIHGFDSSFTITNSNFTTNSGRQTGAITIEDGSLTCEGCIFNSNQGAQVRVQFATHDLCPAHAGLAAVLLSRKGCNLNRNKVAQVGSRCIAVSMTRSA